MAHTNRRELFGDHNDFDSNCRMLADALRTADIDELEDTDEEIDEDEDEDNEYPTDEVEREILEEMEDE